MFPTILIVDDEPSILQSLSGLLLDEGFDVLTAPNGYEALKIIDTESPDLILLDIWMPGLDGIETLKEIKKINSALQVVMITGHGNIETAVNATKLGAFDFIEKPLSIDRVIVSMNNALNFRRLQEENKYLRKKNLEKHTINGNSSAINHLKQQIAIAAPTDAWILITGEHGTGKELVARTLHQFSSRAEEPLITVNCAAIPDELIESELFGHEKGALKGASVKHIGQFEMANRGTIFFDEIGDMSLRGQTIILRTLEEQKFQRLGGSRILQVNVRVIASTNKDLEKLIDEGKFREDLYYRLNVIPIEVPALRNRIEDIPKLIEAFLKESTVQYRCATKKISQEAIDALSKYTWPGNVRELKNLMERLVIMVKKECIELCDLPVPYHHAQDMAHGFNYDWVFSINNLNDAKDEFERAFIKKKMNENNQDIQVTSKKLGISKDILMKKVKKLPK
ncbi:MAG: sigma-54-dependent Fis family transcriptional regulator [Desulfobacterales bacterium]|nr:sigma-54-dependent Fis family transcriptional regulator [Desulfobacterales bacterium]